MILFLLFLIPSQPNPPRGEIFFGNWEDWGKEIGEPLPCAVVIATEMDLENVGAGPHTPALVESSANYALGAYITTILAQWFGGLGYRAVAHHYRHSDLLLVPLAVDAGLGELGRWKLNEETCFEYWGKVGTDRSVCMGICPISRPNRSVHRLVKWLLPRSYLARRILPHLDNWIYGRKWKPRAVASWVQYSQQN